MSFVFILEHDKYNKDNRISLISYFTAIEKRKAPEDFSFGAFLWLSYQDSNLDKQNQKLLCYHYTIGQTHVLSVKKRCKDRGLQANLQIFRSLFYFLSSKSCIITSQSINNSSFYRAEQADISRQAGQQL